MELHLKNIHNSFFVEGILDRLDESSRELLVNYLRGVDEAAQPAALGDAELAELAVLEQQATPGPWLYKPEWVDYTIGVRDTRSGHTDDVLHIADKPNAYFDKGNHRVDFPFIAALRNALPGLLARVRAAEAKVTAIKTVQTDLQRRLDALKNETDMEGDPEGRGQIAALRVALSWLNEATVKGGQQDA